VKEGQEVFFFEKKNQKTFVFLAAPRLRPTFLACTKRQKFFGSFFQKRTASFLRRNAACAA
jgi:hypothetical protein